jgi:hypothetical protein
MKAVKAPSPGSCPAKELAGTQLDSVLGNRAGGDLR